MGVAVISFLGFEGDRVEWEVVVIAKLLCSSISMHNFVSEICYLS